MRKLQMMALLMSGMVLTGVFAGVNTAQADAKTEITLWHYFSSLNEKVNSTFQFS